MFNRVHYLAVSLFVLAIEFPVVADDSVNSLAEIAADWKLRRIDIPALKVELRSGTADQKRMGTYETTWVPSGDTGKDHSQRSEFRLLDQELRFDGVRTMYDPEWEIGGFLQQQTRQYYSGVASDHETSPRARLENSLADSLSNSQRERQHFRNYTLLASPNLWIERFGTADQIPVEIIRGRPPQPSAVDDALYRPLLLWARPFEPPGVGVDSQSENWRIEERLSSVNGHECLRVVEQLGTDVTALRWIDPKRNHVVVREILRKKTKDILQVDIQYNELVGIGWAPHSWTVIYLPDEEAAKAFPGREHIFHTVDVNVTDLQRSADKSDFALAAEPGAVIFDRGKRRYFQFQSDGTEKLLSKKPTLSSGNLSDRILAIPVWMLGLLGVIVIGLCIWAVIRIHRSDSRPLGRRGL